MSDAANFLNQAYGLSSAREVDGKLLISQADNDKLCAKLAGMFEFAAPLVPSGGYGMAVEVCDE